MRYFECARSGSQRGRRSKKLGLSCLARMKVTVCEGKVHVHFVAKHTGHVPEIKDCTIASSMKEQVMEKVLAGVPRDRILTGMFL